MLTQREGAYIVSENLKSGGLKEKEISKSIILAMMGSAAMSVLAGCSQETMEEESNDQKAVLVDNGPDEEVGEARQKSLVASYSNLSIPSGTMVPGSFSKVAGRRYTLCLNPLSGDPDLYGHFSGTPTTGSFQYRSWNSGLTSDCIWFNAGSSGTYYFGINGFSSSTTHFWIVDSPQQTVPANFSRALRWPMPGKTALAVTSPIATYGDSFSPFNSPWGNHEEINEPFYDNPTSLTSDDINRIHAGVDIGAPAGTQVFAACNGVFKAVNSYGGGWGYYATQECTINGTTISIVYGHLNNAGRPTVNSTKNKGDLIGTIYDMNVAGENDHLHLAICTDTYANCNVPGEGQYPQRGSLPHNKFPWKMINPWIVTNPGLWE